MGPHRTLYLDMNSFFASVEQQIDSRLRGRPVAITAMEHEKGCVVAASYEAKAHGVKTGTSVKDARRMCPGIVFRASRHRLYVRYNLRVAAVLDRFAELGGSAASMNSSWLCRARPPPCPARRLW